MDACAWQHCSLCWTQRCHLFGSILDGRDQNYHVRSIVVVADDYVWSIRVPANLQRLLQRRPNLGFSFIYDLAHAHRLNKPSFEIMTKFQSATESIAVTMVTRYHSSACSLTRRRAADSWQSARCQCLLLMPLSVMNLFRTYGVRPREMC